MGWLTKADPAEGLDETLKAELAALQPSDAERARLHGIALVIFLLSLLVGVPLWWMTTTPEQYSLPEDMVAQLTHQRITIGLDVITLNLDPWLSDSDLTVLERTLTDSAAAAQRKMESQRTQTTPESNPADAGIIVNYRFFVRRHQTDASLLTGDPTSSSSLVSARLEKYILKSGLLDRLEVNDGKQTVSADGAFFFVILPHNTAVRARGLVRDLPSRKLIYLWSPCTPTPSSSPGGVPSCKAGAEELASTILHLLNNNLVIPNKLQAAYESVWWNGNDMHSLAPDLQGGRLFANPTDYVAVRRDLARLRTHQLPPSGSYEITITLVSAFSGPRLPVTDDWLWTSSSQGHSLGDWLRLSVEPGLLDLQRYVRLNMYSQYLYAVSLEGFQSSRLSKDGKYRYYDATQLSSLLNSLEAFLGQDSLQSDEDGITSTAQGLHLVILFNERTKAKNATSDRPLRFELPGNGGKPTVTSIALVPQWGCLISLDNSVVTLENLGPTLVNAIRSLLGVPHAELDSVRVNGASAPILFEHDSNPMEVSRWELDSWLLFRAIESISTTSLTLNSLVDMVHNVRNVVIRSYVADRIHASVAAWKSAVDSLAASGEAQRDRLGQAFLSTKTALEKANAAFFDHSLLDLLYFPSDQVFGIYLPLFAPVCLPIVLSGVAAIKFFKKFRATK
ncbi:hypothetical protein SprV_0301320800 [Sparganum proliferum]